MSSFGEMKTGSQSGKTLIFTLWQAPGKINKFYDLNSIEAVKGRIPHKTSIVEVIYKIKFKDFAVFFSVKSGLLRYTNSLVKQTIYYRRKMWIQLLMLF